MRFHYTQRGPATFRPFAPVLLVGPAGTALVDGLLDTGADRVLIPEPFAAMVGFDFDALPSANALITTASKRIPCKTASLILGLRKSGVQTYWHAQVAITTTPLSYCYWGIQGFLEFFRAEFDGPNRVVTLAAGGNLPAAPPPP